MFTKISHFLFQFGVLLGYWCLGSIGFADEWRLPKPSADQSFELIERSVDSVGIVDHSVWVTLPARATIVQVPFKEIDHQGLLPSKKFEDARRISLEFAGKEPSWIAVTKAKNRTILIEGQQLLVTTLTMDGQSMRSDGIVWDLVKPAADSRGQPPRWEIAATRSDFKHKIQGHRGRKLAGVSPMPEKWPESGPGRFLVTTNLPGHPLLLMDCREDVGVACSFVRSCNVDRPVGSVDAKGVGAIPGQRRFLVADQEKNALVVFRYGSCFDIVREKTLFLPVGFKKLAGFTLASNGDLWLTTKAPDDYTNGNLHLWRAEQWLPLVDERKSSSLSH